MNSPSPSDSNGRSTNGRFAAGNRFARGNPHAQRVGKLRSAILQAATPRDVSSVLAKMRDRALVGDTAAARIYLEYAVGKPENVHDDNEDREAREHDELMRSLGTASSPDYLDDDLGFLRIMGELNISARTSIDLPPALPHHVIDSTPTCDNSNCEKP